MPPKDTIWEAAPHTLAKIEILSNYLFLYMRILGRSRRKQPLLYIDGFAGPDEYTNAANGSPTSALRAISMSISELGDNWVAGNVHCVFIEEKQDRFENLKKRLDIFPENFNIRLYPYNSTFVDSLRSVRQKFPTAFQSSNPLFAFIDPFGAKGAPFQTIAELLDSPCSEVLINFDTDGIHRIFQAQESANHTQVLTEIYGNTSWRQVFKKHYNGSQQCQAVLALYKQRLRSLVDVKYVFAFEMRSASDSLNYYLLFASKHPLGLIKMKEAMKKIDQDGSYRFSDARIGQTPIFRFDEPAQYSSTLYDKFKGRKVSYEELRDYTLNETPFVNPSKMLRELEKSDLISDVDYRGTRRKYSFAEDKTNSVTFAPQRKDIQDGLQFDY